MFLLLLVQKNLAKLGFQFLREICTRSTWRIKFDGVFTGEGNSAQMELVFSLIGDIMTVFPFHSNIAVYVATTYRMWEAYYHMLYHISL